MIKKYCDRCGKEIKSKGDIKVPYYVYDDFSYRYLTNKEYDLCECCLIKYVDFLKGDK